ncbi:predicted protein [Streptomyces sp. AA4]|nr:predicted protein [Streptomyces sp. AA4]
MVSMAPVCALDLVPGARLEAGRMPDYDTLRALADEGNETALDRLADLADRRGDLAELSDLLDEGSEQAGRLLTRRAVENRDLRELQRLSDAGSSEAATELERLLRAGDGA